MTISFSNEFELDIQYLKVTIQYEEIQCRATENSIYFFSSFERLQFRLRLRVRAPFEISPGPIFYFETVELSCPFLRGLI